MVNKSTVGKRVHEARYQETRQDAHVADKIVALEIYPWATKGAQGCCAQQGHQR